MSLENKLKIIRHLLELTQDEAAKQIGVSRSSVANWECGISNIQRQLRPRVESWISKNLSTIAKKDFNEGTFFSKIIANLENPTEISRFSS